ncbi:MAG: MCE family protein [Deltaproteobacteria bacterium]|nr:MCE family protein [Deltaproteobacteria bacterium]
MRSIGIEARVGAFVLVALLVLVGFVLALGDFSLRPAFGFYVDFGYSGGLQPGAPVKVSGIRVGRVADLSIIATGAGPPAAAPVLDLGRTATPLVRAQVQVDEAYRHLITEGALLHVGTQGVIGEAYLELSPGGGSALSEGASVRGVDAPRLHVMALQLSAILDTFGQLIGVGSEANQPGAVGEAVGSLVRLVGSIVSERRGELSQALGELAAMAGNLRAVTGELRKAVEGGKLSRLLDDTQASAKTLSAELPDLLARARTSLASVEALTAKANGAVSADDVTKILNDVRASIENVHTLTRDAVKVTEMIRRGQGTVGGLVTDPQIYDDLKEMLRDLKRNPWKFLWRD